MNEIRKCPSCQTPMQACKQPDITTDHCPSCQGIFLDKGELNALATGMAGNIEFLSVDNFRMREDLLRKKRHCPACKGREMHKVNLLTTCDTVFDHCDSCGAFFLDHNEINSMNKELHRHRSASTPKDYRNFHGDYLVRIDTLNNGDAAEFGIVDETEMIVDCYYSVMSVYFKQALPFNIHIFHEGWMCKLFKLFGLFKEQDIHVDNSSFDSAFIIQGNNPTKIKALLSPSVQEAILNFTETSSSIHNNAGYFELFNNRAVYIKGPYHDKPDLNAVNDYKPLIDDMIKLVQLIEK